jgi:hypothetical protein
MKTGTELRREALREVEGCVCKDRQNSYGGAESNFENIAGLWTVWLRTRGLIPVGTLITATDVAAMSGLIKVARAANNPGYRDNWIDLAGYAVCGAGIVALRDEEATAAANAVIGDEERKPAPITTLADYSKLPPEVVVVPNGLVVAEKLRICADAAATSPVAPGHNPDRLTEAQVGVAEGWRLLAPEEVWDRPMEDEAVMRWCPEVGGWDSGYIGSLVTCTYRTKRPPGYFLPSYVEALKAAVAP